MERMVDTIATVTEVIFLAVVAIGIIAMTCWFL